MAEDTTKLIISVETLLKGLDKTLRGLAQVETQLKRVASIKVGGTSTTTQLDRATAAARRLELQQQKLGIQAQTLANRQERADQATQRLAIGQQRLAAAQERLTRASQQQSDAHVKAFQAIERGTKQANQAIIGLGNSLRSVGQGLASLGATLSVTLTAPIVALGTASTAAVVKMDSLKRGLTAIVGSSTEAGRQLARLTELAKLPGIGFEEAIQGSIRLQAVGFSAKEAERSLRQFANAVALTGGGREELARITVQLGQLAAKGKVLSQDLRPIIEAAPAVGRALKEAFGTVNADDIADLTSSSKEFLDILVGQLEKLPRAAAGAKNSFENFRDTVFRAAAAIGEALLPTLTQLVDILGPVITAIAEGFRTLPAPLRTTLVIVTALVAALGPVVFVVGQLTTGIGRIIVGLAQLNALGLLPTIRNLRLFTAGTLAAAEAEGTLAAASVATGVAIAGLAAVIGTIVIAYIAWRAAQSDTIEVSKEQLEASREQVESLKDQVKFLDGLRDGVARTADEQERLRDVYRALNTEARARVEGAADEEKRLATLRAEVERLLQARLQEREQQTAVIAASLATTQAEIDLNERRRDSITRQIQTNTRLIETLQQQRRFTNETVQALRALNINTGSVTESVEQLQARTLILTETQAQLGQQSDELNTRARDIGERLRALGVTSTESARQFLVLAQAMGLFKGDIEATLPTLERYIVLAQQSAEATDSFTKALKAQKTELQQAGDLADKLQKERRQTISDAAATAREAASDFEGALKFMRAFIAAQPQLQAAIKREAQIQGKSIEEIIRESLGDRGKRQTGLASAQAQLAKQLEDIAKAKSEKIVALQEQENERLLAENETAFKQQLRSYEQYLQERARLTIDSLDKEIIAQIDAAIRAQKTQLEINRQRTKPLSKAQDIKLRIKASEAEERELKALTKAAELETKRNDLVEKLKQAQTEAVLEQERNIRQLAIEYANLQGRVESAFAAESEERSRERLQALSREQDFIRTRLNLELNGIKVIKGEERARLENKRRLNQQEIEGITNIQRQNDGLAKLVGAEKKVADAKAEQSALESRLEFQVKFRGLAEEDAIQQRLAGEAKVRDALLEAEQIVERTIASFGTITPPKALTDALRDIRTELLGLAELDFATKFRLAQKEFDRINDLRIQKIQQVERAVAHRDISELQGRIAIKAANGEYIGALQRQLEILQQIAAQSGDAGLQRQAQDARTTTEEVKDATTAVADLNTELKSAAIDSLRDAFAGMGRSLVDVARGAVTAKEALLDMLDQVAGRLTDIAFDRLADRLFGGLLGGATQAPLGGLGEAAGAGVGGGALQTAAVATGAALTSGGTAAGAAMTAGGVSAGASIVTAAAAFAAAVTAAAAAFAATIAASAGASAIGGIGGVVGGAAATGMFPAVPGGLIHIVEGGHDEAVLSTDPKYATRQAGILREYLAKTRGLWGRIPSFAEGGLVSAADMEASLLSGLNQSRRLSPLSAPVPAVSSPSGLRLRQILIDDKRRVGDWVNSSEGEQVLVDFLHRHSSTIRRIR